jgi:hypothetical protein
MHAVTFLTAVSIPSLTTILEHISAVHPLLFAMSFFPLTATMKPVQKFGNAKLAYCLTLHETKVSSLFMLHLLNKNPNRNTSAHNSIGLQIHMHK